MSAALGAFHIVPFACGAAAVLTVPAVHSCAITCGAPGPRASCAERASVTSGGVLNADHAQQDGLERQFEQRHHQGKGALQWVSLGVFCLLYPPKL